ncbi:hypothetical protein PN462_21030 [Spirulina sp. CS-785/01]|uniref:hypothetical protein n=1 Tax=Spirulina sp. CS-785/01 TaxID=3021716 RepID=UPI00233031B9|nr:hypothetical protein [Spirulina sp. CS-785/01]MDB9315610.1 hypothetical protein [Spirulina sp. CS-785/01]
MKVLQCHSKGDLRFSPFFCQVSFAGVKRSIETHYQCAKRFKFAPIPKSWKEAKDYQKAGFERLGFQLPNGLYLPPDTYEVQDLAVQFYIALWYKYLRLHPQLIEYASQFDEFEDIFKGQFPFSQADVIRQAVQEGIESLKPLCSDFLNLCSHFIQQDILTVQKGIIVHQVDCEGKMQSKLGQRIREKYPAVYEAYLDWYHKDKMTLGTVQLVKIHQDFYVANLAGQEKYSLFRTQAFGSHTDYDAVQTGLVELEHQGKQLNLKPFIPYRMGCGFGGGEWRIVCGLILKHCPSALICKC